MSIKASELLKNCINYYLNCFHVYTVDGFFMSPLLLPDLSTLFLKSLVRCTHSVTLTCISSSLFTTEGLIMVPRASVLAREFYSLNVSIDASVKITLPEKSLILAKSRLDAKFGVGNS